MSKSSKNAEKKPDETPAGTPDASTVADNPDGQPERVGGDDVERQEAAEDVEHVAELDEAAEVFARSADNREASTNYRKVFVLQPGTYTKDAYDHEPNLGATRQEAINRGLWPTGKARQVGGARKHPDGTDSVVLTYEVPVAIAHEVGGEAVNPEVRDVETGSVDDARNTDAAKA